MALRQKSSVRPTAAREVLELCQSFHRALSQCEAESSVAVARTNIAQLARAVVIASHDEKAMALCRRPLLDAIVAGLQGRCIASVVEHFGFCIFPAALLLIGRICHSQKASGTFAACSHLAHDPSLSGPILSSLTSSLDSPGDVVEAESLLRLLAVQAPVRLRSSLHFHRILKLLRSSSNCSRELAASALAKIVGLSVVHAPHDASSIFERRLLCDRGHELRPHVSSLFLELTSTNETAEASRASWDEDRVRCRHGVCFQVIDPSVKEQMPFISTETASQAMRELLLAIGMGSPVLLTGPPGVGKTTFLRKAAELSGQHEPSFLFCDEQTDIKMLLGAYVCGQNVGEFVWRPGVVTEALQKGRWLVLEDVDRVPAEVLAALLPLSDSRRLVIPDRNQQIDAHEDFQLFGTLSTGGQTIRWQPLASSLQAAFEESASEAPSGGLAGGTIDDEMTGPEPHEIEFGVNRVPALVSTWTRVRLASLEEEDLLSILIGLFPEFSSLKARLLASAAVLRVAASKMDQQ
jgi:energy-coupling factor transporter ATP-binding protein EcfA2